MKYMKIIVIIFIMFLTIGYAATNITLSITGDAYIASDIDDFEVYFSSLKLNGVEDMSIFKSATEFEFETVGLGEFFIEYEVTNASKKFDANVDVVCDINLPIYDEDEYTSVFYGDGVINARESEEGYYLINKGAPYKPDTTLIVNCKIEATPVERNEYGSGDVSDVFGAWLTGKVVYIDTEKFNVISSTEHTVTLLAYNVIGSDYKQIDSTNYVSFADSNGWSYTPGPKDIEIQSYNGNAKTYVNEYVEYLKTLTGSKNITGNLITVSQLGNLGCTISSTYASGTGLTCANSQHKDWLVNGKYWWTRSASSDYAQNVWAVSSSGSFVSSGFTGALGIRPIITLPKEVLDDFIVSFTIEGVEYQTYVNMTWEEWVDSEFNIGREFAVGTCTGFGFSSVCTEDESGTWVFSTSEPNLVVDIGNTVLATDSVTLYTEYYLADYGMMGAPEDPI